MKLILTLNMIWITGIAFSQVSNTPFIRLTNPYKTANAVRSSRQFITGATCKSCSLTINGIQQKVYPTGAFAYELNLLPGDSVISLLAEAGGKSLTKKINYTYSLPKAPEPVSTLSIESIKTLPEGTWY